MDPAEINRYYLQVKKSGETPKWPRPQEELVLGSQDLGDGYTQYWAYHQDSPKTSDDLPPAEVVASENPTPKPAVLVDQPRPVIDEKTDDVLDLILVKDGHAFYYLSSSIASLKENIETILTAAEDEFGMSVEHFMTTGRVSDEVEKALDELEDSEQAQGESAPEDRQIKAQDQDDQPPGNGQGPDAAEQKDEAKLPPSETSQEEEEAPFEDEAPQDNLESLAADEPGSEDLQPKTSSQTVEPKPANMADVLSDTDMGPPIRHVNTHPAAASGVYLNQSQRAKPPGANASRVWLLIPIILLLLAFGSVFIFKDRLFSVVGNTAPAPKPTPTLAPTPTPTLVPIKRGEYKVRVLNGTTRTGAARTLADSLKEKGWMIDKVGNNPDQAVSSGYVRFKESKKDAYPTLLSDLGSGYTASASSLLKDSDSADLEVVIGGQ